MFPTILVPEGAAALRGTEGSTSQHRARPQRALRLGTPRVGAQRGRVLEGLCHERRALCCR